MHSVYIATNSRYDASSSEIGTASKADFRTPNPSCKLIDVSLYALVQLLWKGQEAFEAALELIAAAEHASKQSDPVSEPFVWRQDILRPAADASQVPSAAYYID